MSGLGKVILGAVVGAVLGIVIPIVLAILYVVLGGNAQGAGAFSFFPIVLVPLGLYLGGMTGSVWSPARTIGRNILAGLCKAFRPSWI
jgi:glycerol uptake facilitator-like aquaporin